MWNAGEIKALKVAVEAEKRKCASFKKKQTEWEDSQAFMHNLLMELEASKLASVAKVSEQLKQATDNLAAMQQEKLAWVAEKMFINRKRKGLESQLKRTEASLQSATRVSEPQSKEGKESKAGKDSKDSNVPQGSELASTRTLRLKLTAQNTKLGKAKHMILAERAENVRLQKSLEQAEAKYSQSCKLIAEQAENLQMLQRRIDSLERQDPEEEEEEEEDPVACRVYNYFEGGSETLVPTVRKEEALVPGPTSSVSTTPVGRPQIPVLQPTSVQGDLDSLGRPRTPDSLLGVMPPRPCNLTRPKATKHPKASKHRHSKSPRGNMGSPSASEVSVATTTDSGTVSQQPVHSDHKLEVTRRPSSIPEEEDEGPWRDADAESDTHAVPVQQGPYDYTKRLLQLSQLR